MKITAILYLLIFLFTILLIQPLFDSFAKEGMEEGMEEGMKEGMDDCLVGTLSDIKSQLTELQKQVSDNSEELKELKKMKEPEETVLAPPSKEDQETYNQSSEMLDLINSD
jgi:hypothetical protein